MTGPAQSLSSSEVTKPGDGERLSEVRFLTVAEVAALMRVSKMTVYRLVHGGELTAVRVGRSFRVPEHAVHAYLRGAFSQTA
jgi:excisionase family DNA binding protein